MTWLPLQAVSIAKINSKEDLAQAESLSRGLGTVIMDASDWQIIPAGVHRNSRESTIYFFLLGFETSSRLELVQGRPKWCWCCLGMLCSFNAENLVAAFQGQPASLFGVAKSAKDARILLEALEVGTDGVLLRTNDAQEVRVIDLSASICSLHDCLLG